MKAYKGFKKYNEGAMYCRNFIYEEGKTYTLPRSVAPKLCECGFHACTLPMDVFEYYNSSNYKVEFHEVELSGKIVSDEEEIDSKVCASKITIGRKITPDEMVEISIKMMLENKEKYFGKHDVIRIKKDLEQNYINSEGKILSETWFDCVRDVFIGGFGCVMKDGKWNFIDKDGKLLSETWFDYISVFNEGFGRVCMDGKWKYIGKDGSFLSPEGYDACVSFINGFGLVYKAGKYNFIKPDGTFLSETWFDTAHTFDQGFGRVYMDGKWNFIDKDGKYLCEEWLDYAFSFGIAGVALVEKDGKLYDMGTDGKLEEHK